MLEHGQLVKLHFHTSPLSCQLVIPTNEVSIHCLYNIIIEETNIKYPKVIKREKNTEIPFLIIASNNTIILLFQFGGVWSGLWTTVSHLIEYSSVSLAENIISLIRKRTCCIIINVNWFCNYSIWLTIWIKNEKECTVINDHWSSFLLYRYR